MTPPTEVLTLEDIAERENERLARIERALVYVGFAACTFTLLMGLYLETPWAMGISLFGIGLLTVPFVLASLGREKSAALLIVLVPLMMVTLTAATGRGLQDPAVAAFPVILIFAGMTLDRRAFALLVTLFFAAIAFVHANQVWGMLPVRTEDFIPVFASVVVSIMIMVVTTVCVWVLAEGTREGLKVAHGEIERRMIVESNLAELSQRDSLTGLYNLRAFDEEAERFRVERRYPVSVIIVDVDDLKRTNDTHGHAFGNQLIVDAAQTLSSATRADDMLARIGGDEFALLLPETDERTAAVIAVRIERALEKHNATPGKPRLNLSFGTATADMDGLPSALILADRAMYEQKAAKKRAS